MPFPVQTDRQEIINTAYAMIRQNGVDDLSLARLAAELGIKAPSLYRHVKNKEALVQAVIEKTYLKLFTAYDEALAAAPSAPLAQLMGLAHAHRRFAHDHAQTYTLAYATAEPELASNPSMLLERALSVQSIMGQITGDDHAHDALRGFLALIHGFVMLELNGQFRRGGDISATFDANLQAFLHGWSH